jgi:hypothetical protein
MARIIKATLTPNPTRKVELLITPSDPNLDPVEIPVDGDYTRLETFIPAVLIDTAFDCGDELTVDIDSAFFS